MFLKVGIQKQMEREVLIDQRIPLSLLKTLYSMPFGKEKALATVEEIAVEIVSLLP